MKLFLTIFIFALTSTLHAGLIVGKKETAVVSYGTALSNDVSTVNTTTTTLWTIPAKTVITDVKAYVTTTATGGNITIGDGSDTDGYLTTGFEDTSAFYGNDSSSYGTYRGAYLSSNTTPLLEKYYSSADTIDVTLSATPLTTGQITFFIEYYRVK